MCGPAGAEALSRYGQEFLAEVERLLGECGRRRELAAGRLEALKLEQEEALELLSRLSLERQERRAREQDRQARGSQGPGRGSEGLGRGFEGPGRGSQGPGRGSEDSRRGSEVSGKSGGRGSGYQTPKGRGLEHRGWGGFVAQENHVEGPERSLELHRNNLEPPSGLLEHQEGSVEQKGNRCSEQDSSSDKQQRSLAPSQQCSASDSHRRERSVGRRGSVGSDKSASGKQPTAPLSGSAKQRALKKAPSADMTADTGPRRSPAQPAGVIQRPARSAAQPRKFPPTELAARPEWQS